MTISELIFLLQSYPKDMIVVDDLGLIQPENIKVVQGYYLGDSANPQCKILKNALKIE